jgi:inner membrane protein YidH
MSNVNGRGGDSDSDGSAADRTGQYLVYFASERTLLAWIRAALGLMALGFVIDRFGLVVRSMAPQAGKIVPSSMMSFLAGAGLVVVGGLMAIVAAVRYAHFAWRYRRTGDTDPGYGLAPAIVFTVAVALAGAVIAGFLMTMVP